MRPIRILRPGFAARRIRELGRRPRLGSAAVDAVLADYGERRQGTIAALRDGGGRSASVLVTTDRGRRLLKRYRPAVRDEAIALEHSVIGYLALTGYRSSVRLVARAADGSTLARHGADRYALFPFVPDTYQYYRYLMPRTARQRFVARSGSLLASFHAALRGFVPQGMNWIGFDPATGRRARDQDWYRERLEACLAASRDTADPMVRELVQRAEPMAAELAGLEAMLDSAQLERQVIHGDFGPHNVLFRDADVPVIVDLEIARLDWRALEVANALWRFGFDERRGPNLDDMAAFLEAYQTNLPLRPDDLALLPELWRFSHLRRAITNWEWLTGASQVEARRKVKRHLWMLDWMTHDASRFRAAVTASLSA